MTSMLEQIEKLLQDKQYLAKLYKDLRHYRLKEELQNKFNNDNIYIEDIDYDLNIQSLITANDWYDLLEFSNDIKELADDMFQYEESFNINIEIKNKDEYLNLHPTIDRIKKMINHQYNINEFNDFIKSNYNNKVEHYYKYICKTYYINDIISTNYNFKITLIKDVSFIAQKLYNYCMQYDKQPKEIINSEKLYEFIINLNIVLLYFEIETTNDIYLPNPLQL